MAISMGLVKVAGDLRLYGRPMKTGVSEEYVIGDGSFMPSIEQLVADLDAVTRRWGRADRGRKKD